jgi:Short C-terminal domain/Bacterial PH domain
MATAGARFMKPLANLFWFILGWVGALAIVVSVVVTVGYGWVLIPTYLALAVAYWALVFGGVDVRRARAGEKLTSTLMASEQKLGDAIQFRLCALLSRRLVVAATNSRIILIRRSLLGGFTMKDYQWKDLYDAKLSENVLPKLFGSRLSFSIRPDGKGEIQDRLEIDGIDGRSASQIYATAQEQEQAWEEKRRVRTMEEARASSGGISLGGFGSGPGAGKAGGSALDELERAKKLLDSGVISDVEFNEMKSKILSREAF